MCFPGSSSTMPSSSSSSDSESEELPPAPRHLILLGYKRPAEGTWHNQVLALNVDEDLQPVALGGVKALIQWGADCCVVGHHLVMCALGEATDEVWKFDLKSGSSALVCK